MTTARLLVLLRQRIAASHTTGGLSVVAADLGVSKQLLHNIVTGLNVPTAETKAALAAALSKGGRA